MAEETRKPVSPLAQRTLQQLMAKQVRESQEIAALVLADAGLSPQEWGVDFEAGAFVKIPTER